MPVKLSDSSALEHAKRVLGVPAEVRPDDREFLAQQPRQIKTKAKDIWAEVAKQVSDHTVRAPKTPDREEPHVFDPWVDVFGQAHGEIDWDAEFQSNAFDRALGQGTNPLNDTGSDRPSHASGIRYGDEALEDEIGMWQGLGIEDSEGKKIGVRTGLLPGDRPIKRRRPNKKTWWIFCDEGGFLEQFLKAKYPRDDEKHRTGAARALYVLIEYYLRYREDKEICAIPPANEWAASFQNERAVKSFRQELVKAGVVMFGEDKNLDRPHERKYVKVKKFVAPKPGSFHGTY